MADPVPHTVTRQFLQNLFRVMPYYNPNMKMLPDEVADNIITRVVGLEISPAQPSWTDAREHPALTPPANGTAPFMTLPTELRRSIFARSLPSNDVIHYPSCKDNPKARFTSKHDPKAKPVRNTVSDLMTLNKKICGEMTEVLYEERFFVIHVHEGLRDGGIEFQDAVRQPLQYKDSLEDARFYKFCKNDEFGFDRLKKIIIEIRPSKEDNDRHTAINTYFINQALCRMLDRSGDQRSRINYLHINFPEDTFSDDFFAQYAAKLRGGPYWWDPNRNKPRETSVHNLSNIELVLRPFAMLTGCHGVNIQLPEDLRDHQPSVKFVEKLTRSMMSRHGSLFMDDDLEHKIESARYAMEEYVNYTLHGKGHHAVAKLTEAEMEEDGVIDFDDDREVEIKVKKHDLSPPSKERGGVNKRVLRSTSRLETEVKEDPFGQIDFDDKDPEFPNSIFDDQEEDQQRAIQCSIREEEERQVQAAIAASLASFDEVQWPVPSDPSILGFSDNDGCDYKSDSLSVGQMSSSPGAKILGRSIFDRGQESHLTGQYPAFPNGQAPSANSWSFQSLSKPVTSASRFANVEVIDLTGDSEESNAANGPAEERFPDGTVNRSRDSASMRSQSTLPKPMPKLLFAGEDRFDSFLEDEAKQGTAKGGQGSVQAGLSTHSMS